MQPSGHVSPMLPGALDGKHEQQYGYGPPGYSNHPNAWPVHQPASLMDDEGMYSGPPGMPQMGHAGMGHPGGPNGAMMVTPQNQKYSQYSA